MASCAKLVFLWADYTFGYFIRIRPALVRSTLVVFDRYYYDILADTLRFRYGGPKWLMRLVYRLIPRPELILILHAPAEVLQMRKQEVPMAESARQTEIYRSLARERYLRSRSVLVDVSSPLQEVVHRCADATLEYMEKRTARRMKRFVRRF